MVFSGVLSSGLPFEDPVAVFALAMLVFLGFPLFFKQFDLPGITSVLLIGVVIGPHVLNLLERSEAIILLGEVGLLYLMFISGLEIDLNDFLDDPTRSGVFALITFSLPMIVGTVSGAVILGFSLPAAVLFASLFSSHTILGYPVVSRLNIVKNEAITTTISGTILTDTVALLILVVIENLHSQSTVGLLFWGQFGLKLLVFFGGIWVAVPRIGRWFFRNVDEESYFEFLFAMAVLFGTAFLAQVVGAEPIIGAFLAGLTMNRLIPSMGTLQNRIDFIGDALFIPFFFLTTGMIVQPSLFLRGIQPWLVAGTILVVMFGMKLVAAWGTGRIYGYERFEWLTMYGLSTGQAAAALAVATIGANIGLFDQAIVNGVVLMILITGVVSPYLSERYGRAIVEAEEQAEYEPSKAPERILIPLTKYTDNTDSLLDLAMLLRGSSSDESIRALTVVEREGQQLDIGERYTSSGQPDMDGSRTDDQSAIETQQPPNDQQTAADQQSEETEAKIADAEETLEETEEQAASAEVPIDTQTRVEYSIVTGIVQAIEENRITTVIMGWDTQRRFGQRLFGSTIDQLLERTSELVVVANLTQPINTTERLVVVLPGRIAAHPGFYAGVHMVKQMAKQLGIPLQYLLITGDQDRYEQLIEPVDPETPFEIESIGGWNQFRSDGGDQFNEGDLVVALSPREGARGWQSSLNDIPPHLAQQAPANVMVMYLSEDADASRSSPFMRME